MNTKRLLKLASDLEALSPDSEFRFDIGIVARPGYPHDGKDCGTVGCVAGYVMWNYLRARLDAYGVHMISPRGEHVTTRDAGEWLELTPAQEDELFYGFSSISQKERITERQAARVIRDFVSTGIVDWHILEVYRAGRTAHGEGREMMENPHNFGSRYRNVWWDGWMDSKEGKSDV